MEKLDPKIVRAFALSRHAATTFRESPPRYADPADIGSTAKELLRQFYECRAYDMPQSNRQIGLCAAYLIYAYELYGCTHEVICDLADFRVANVLEVLTPHVQLPQVPRHEANRLALSRASAIAQLVRLAELRCSYWRLKSLPDSVFTKYAKDIRRWLEEAWELTGVMNRLTDCAKIESFVSKFRSELHSAVFKSDQRDRDIRRLSKSLKKSRGESCGRGSQRQLRIDG